MKSPRSFTEVFDENDLAFGEFIESDDPKDTAENNKLRREGRKAHILKLIMTTISIYLDDVNKKELMNDGQIMRTAGFILDEYPRLQIGDLRLWLRFIFLEKYGQVYNVNIQTFLGWMKKYWDERMVEYNEYVYEMDKEKERKEREKLGSEAVEMPMEIFQPLLDKIEKNKENWKQYLER